MGRRAFAGPGRTASTALLRPNPPMKNLPIPRMKNRGARKMFIELHMIQNFAPSNLNRDDTNNPKDCVFGGARRARISSQCLKRAIRTAPSFSETVGAGTGIRSRLIAGEFQNRFVAQGAGEEEARAIAEALASAYTKREKKGKKDKASADDDEGTAEGARTSVLVYLSPEEIDLLSDRVLSNWEGILQE